MNQKAIKIKISVGNGAVAELPPSEPPKDEYVVLGPNYPGIAVILCLSAALVGGGWWLFSEPSESVSPPIVSSEPISAPIKAKVSPLVGPLYDLPGDFSAAQVEKTNTSVLTADDHSEQLVVAAEPVTLTVTPEEPMEKASESVTVEVVPELTKKVVAVPPVKPAPDINIPKAQALPVITTDNRVARAQFTHGVYKREPVDAIDQLSLADMESGSLKLYFFSELKGLQGKTVTHRWSYEDKEVANVKFRVRGDRWRVYSSKNIQASKDGVWKVTVQDEHGNVLHASQLKATD